MVNAIVTIVLLATSLLRAIAAPPPHAHDDVKQQRTRSARSLKRRQNVGVVGVDQFYRRGYHASTLVGQRLFIDGGEYSYLSEGTVKFTYEPNTLVLDVSRSWSPATANFSVIAKPSGAPILNYPTLWYNAARNELLQGFAGAVSVWPNSSLSAVDLSLWSLKLDDDNNNNNNNNNTGGNSSGVSGSWTELLYTRHSAFGTLMRPLDGLSAFGGDSAYVLGGYASRETTPGVAGEAGRILLPGLVHYNMTSATFSNLSATAYYGTGSAQRGRMVHVPTYGSSSQGLYVMLGGDSVRLGSAGGYTPSSGLLSFANVTLFDPATRQWYWQTARGEVPRSRLEFCAAGARSTNGTYEIFIYGGWSGNLGAVAVSYDEVFVLSLPAFRWFRAPYAARHPRHAHTCHVVGQRHLLSVGGVDTTQDRPLAGGGGSGFDLATFATRDPFPQGLGILDITRLNWTTHYEANVAPYEQSAPVAAYYKNNSRYPPQWDSPKLQPLLQESADARSRLPPPNDALPHHSSTDNDNNHNNNNKVRQKKKKLVPGTIAGIVVGAASAILMTVFATIIALRRRRRRNELARQEKTKRNDDDNSAQSSGVAELPSPRERLAWEMPAGSEAGAHSSSSGGSTGWPTDDGTNGALPPAPPPPPLLPPLHDAPQELPAADQARYELSTGYDAVEDMAEVGENTPPALPTPPPPPPPPPSRPAPVLSPTDCS